MRSIRCLQSLLVSVLLAFLCGCGSSGSSPTTPDFTVSVATPSLFVPLGLGGAIETVSISAVNGFSAPVSVSFSGLPNGVTTSPALPVTINPGNNQSVTLTASSGAAQGVQTVTVNASSGATNHSTTFSVSVANPAYAYLVAGSPSNSLLGYLVDANTGNLSPVPSSPVVLPNAPIDLAVASESGGNFVFVLLSNANTGAVTLQSYGVDAANGALTSLQTITYAAGTGQNTLEVDPAGRFLYVTQAVSALAYTIDPNTGNLTQASISNGVTNQFVIAPPGNYAYMSPSSPFGGLLQIFSVSPSNGFLNRVNSFTLQTGGLLFSDPGGLAVYQLQSLGTVTCGAVTAWQINSGNGSLTNLNTNFTAPCSPQWMTFDPNDRFAFVSSTTGSSNSQNGIYVGTITSGTGNLVLLSGSPFGTNVNATFGAVEPSVHYLVEYTNSNGNNPLLQSYSISSNGAVAAVTNAQAALPNSTFSVKKMFIVGPSN